MEQWRNIEGYEGLYQVSNECNVKSVERTIIRSDGRTQHIKEKILSQTLNKDGYLRVKLSKGGVEEPKKVHQLVAEAFLPNPNNYDTVHHINGEQTDNRIENLMWISDEEHRALHAAEKAELFGKTVYQLEDDEIVNIWKSTHEVERVLGFDQGNISKCCNGKHKTAYKFSWSYSPLEYIKKNEDFDLVLL